MQGGVEFGVFTSWAARIMCEPVDDTAGSEEDNEEEDEMNMDSDGWRRGKSRQYGGGTARAAVEITAQEEQPPPMSSIGLAPAENIDGFGSAPMSWEYRRDEATGITVRTSCLLVTTSEMHVSDVG